MEFEFEELMSEILGITDEQREDDIFLEDRIYEEFGICMRQALDLTLKLIRHCPIVKAGLTGTEYRAFVSRKDPVILMKIKESEAAQ